MLGNKLGIINPAELARIEEKISKKKSLELFESGSLDELEQGLLKPWRRYTSIYLRKSMISREKRGT